MGYETIILEKKENIATITLNRPNKLNAYNPPMRDELAHAINLVDQDDEIRVVIITGTGRAFSSGADIKEGFHGYVEKREKEAGVGEDVTVGFATPGQIYGAWMNLRKPIIASLNGLAMGVGLSLALLCDIRIASETARFQYAFTRMGAASGMSTTYILSRLMGIGKACEFVFTSKWIDAKEAKEIGLVNQVVPAEELAKATYEMASSIAKLPPLAVRLAKRSLYLDMSADQAIQAQFGNFATNYLRGSEDFKEATKAFLEKREPVFKGR
ncbi:enoyl-CoA hydratase/isomerase family protein [Chloroflexota bacterium]